MSATLERSTDAAAAEPAAPARPDRGHPARPVFASETQRRARLLRVLGWGLAGLTALWLAAFVLGAFGLRPLPAIGLPQVPGASERPPSVDRAVPATGTLGSRRNEDGASPASGRSASESALDESSRTGRRPRGGRSSSTDERTGGSPPSDTGSGGSGPSSGTSATAPPAPAPAPTSPGSSATAPGAVNRPDRTTDVGPGNSGSAPGAARSGDRRGGPKADTATP